MRSPTALALDGALVLAFAAVGRRSHAEAGSVTGLLATAWPFLAGLGAGWLLARLWRRPAAVRSGAAAWAGALGVGMALRALTGAGVTGPFVLVAGVTLAVVLVGWRVLWRWAGGRRERRPPG